MFKITQQLKRRSKIWLAPWNIYSTGLGLILWALLVTNLWADWRTEVIATFPGQYLYPVTMGVGRNDDTVRLYVVTNDTASYPALPRFRTVKEITYSNNQWYITPVCSLAPIKVGTMPSFTLADGRNDGTNRLYLVSDSSFYEFTFSNEKWQETAVVKHSSYLEGLLATSGRNDDIIRLYSSGAEFSFTGDSWVVNQTNIIVDWFPMFAGTGRNDGTVRIYDSWGDEWTYRNGGWTKEHVLEFGFNPSAGIGDGRSDSIIRIYASALDTVPPGHYLWECTFDGVTWEKEIMHTIGGGIFGGVADAKNSGKNQIYFLAGVIYVYEWQADHWTCDSIPISTECKHLLLNVLNGYAINQNRRLSIGNGRNDDTNRLYCRYDKVEGIIEITWVPKGINEPSLSANEKISSLFVYPNPSHEKAVIHCSTSFPAEIYIYNSVGQLIKKYIKTLGGNAIFYWDGKNWLKRASGGGVYFCVLKSNSEIKVEKIVLLN